MFDCKIYLIRFHKKGDLQLDKPAIKFENVTYRYPGAEKPAIENVSLEIKIGETVLLTGPSGAGKSTLCYMLNGIVPHSFEGELQGDIIVNGVNTKERTIGELAFISGMLFQDPNGQLINPTVEDEIAFGPENKGLPVEKINASIDKYINYVNMGNFRKRSPQALSGGQQQSVAFASVLSMEPEIYVLDEPTSNLDPLGSDLTLKLMDKIANEAHKTVVLVEHKIEKVIDFVDRIIVLNDGKIVYDGSPKAVMLNYERLNKIGVMAPQLTQMLSIIKNRNLPSIEIRTNFDESLHELRKALNGKELNINKETEEKGFKKFRTFHKKAIEVQDVHFSYVPETEILHGINMTVYEGEFLSIVGQNGSGKTTIVKHFNGLLKPTSGHVLIFGEKTSDHTISYLSTKVGYCFQNPDHQIFSSRTWDEIAYGPKNLGVRDSEIKEVVEKVSKILGIEDLLEENPYNLSKGQRQQVAVASILAMSPDVIVVDEPTTGQDPRQSREMMDLMKSLNEEYDKTIVVITHDMNIAAEYSDRLVVMHSGNVLVEGTPREVFAQEDLLKQSNLEPPQITKAMLKLGMKESLPIDLAEAGIVFDDVLGVNEND